ncbi:MAG: hypothetical protein K2J86_09015, partial [Prevotella sp.]|nr:hypothetical protein [Prevotella sp.]
GARAPWPHPPGACTGRGPRRGREGPQPSEAVIARMRLPISLTSGNGLIQNKQKNDKNTWQFRSNLLPLQLIGSLTCQRVNNLYKILNFKLSKTHPTSIEQL